MVVLIWQEAVNKRKDEERFSVEQDIDIDIVKRR